MKTIPQHLKTVTLAIVITLFAVGTVMAEDIEIYLGNNLAASEIRPNITFILDTSGSMSTSDVPDTSDAYNPSYTYSGSCNTSNVYWTTSSAIPDCGTTNQYVSSASNTCKASFTALGNSSGATGSYTDIFAQKNGSAWGSLSPTQHTNYIECKSDWGKHGQTTGSSLKYPANASNGPWNSNSSKGINWGLSGSAYTLYSGNYLNWRANPVALPVNISRITAVKKVFANLINSLSDTVNIAVMRYDDKSASLNRGGYFVMPMQQLTDLNRQSYIDAVNAFAPGGYTPLAETLYESYLFYRGDPVKFGNSTTPGINVAGVLKSDITNYLSPIQYPCQKNFVVFLTDGEPTYDTDADSAIKALPGFSAATGSANCSGDCMDELAQYMNSKDCRTDLDGIQNVSLYTIGFGRDVVHTPPNPPTAAETLLTNAASKGGGKFYTAVSTADLSDKFNSILVEILADNTTFTAPSVSVNAFNRASHRDDLYFAIFLPSSSPKWYGNIKRFKLNTSGVIVDANGVDATDPNTGFFKSTATSFWTSATDAPDGEFVVKGGAASKLALPRTIYTYTGATSPSNENLSLASNTLSESNAAITKTMLGDAAMTDARRTAILQWTRGVDLLDEDTDAQTNDIRSRMGALLHAKPVLVTYGGTDASPDMTLFGGTNEGNLVALNAMTGSEVFSFIPQELLPNLATLYDNSADVSLVYGMDGPLTTWINDANGNNSLADGGDFVYLYQGMRRGGRNYYAYDVTNRAAPKLKWIIKSGTGAFTELAQTWSSAVKTRIKLNGVDKTVLIFGGGYDTAQDSNNAVQNDSVGRAVFIVDADTGAKLWQAGPAGSGATLTLSGMNYSIPSDVTIIDTNGDGYADRMYVGDMGAQIWRFDINKSNTGASNLATGGILARLGDNTPEGNRRFYYAPDVSLAKSGTHFNIAIGSGYREHPLDTVIHDAFFIVRDPNVYGPSRDAAGNAVYTTVTLNDMYDATSNLIGQGTAAQVTAETTLLATKKGWYIWLRSPTGSFIGEKVLAKSVTISDTVLFTTYTPTAAAPDSCSPSRGVSYLYYMNTKDGTPVDDHNSDNTLTAEDRKVALIRGGIHSTPTLVVINDNDPSNPKPPVKCLADTESCGITPPQFSPSKTFWKVQ